MEYDLLIYMKFHEGIALSRDELIRAVWGYSFLGDSRTIDTHIKSLRRKLGPYRGLVKTVWGKGYKYLEG
jgi:DNA-binding response OmpR family regulator